jgi:hypothetical protein
VPQKAGHIEAWTEQFDTLGHCRGSQYLCEWPVADHQGAEWATPSPNAGNDIDESIGLLLRSQSTNENEGGQR